MIPITAMIKIGAGSLYLCSDKSLRIKSNNPLIVERAWVGAEYTQIYSSDKRYYFLAGTAKV